MEAYTHSLLMYKTLNNNVALPVIVRYDIIDDDDDKVTDIIFLFADISGNVLSKTNPDMFSKIHENNDKDDDLDSMLSSDWHKKIANWVKNNYPERFFKTVPNGVQEYLEKKAAYLQEYCCEELEKNYYNVEYESFDFFVRRAIEHYKLPIHLEYGETQWWNDFMLGGIDSYNAIKVSYQNSWLNRFNPPYRMWYECTKNGEIIPR